MAKSRKTYTEEFKVEAVKLILENQQTVTETANNLGISLSALTRWKSNYLNANQNPKAAFPGKGNLSPHDAELKALQKENQKLKRERDILKKAMAYFAQVSE
jgi:transposase